MPADGEFLVPWRFYLADRHTSSRFTGRRRSARHAGLEIARKPGTITSHKSPGTFLACSDVVRRQQLILAAPKQNARPRRCLTWIGNTGPDVQVTVQRNF
jgi:hypothetical protein